jgi:hypothetical protein
MRLAEKLDWKGLIYNSKYNKIFILKKFSYVECPLLYPAGVVTGKVCDNTEYIPVMLKCNYIETEWN